MNTYSSAQRTYMRFCSTYNLPPIPLTERLACLLVAHLAERGRPQSISAYMAGVRHLQITAGTATPQRQEWPRLQLVMRGIRRSQAATPRTTRLPITFAIMKQLQSAFPMHVDSFTAKLLWPAWLHWLLWFHALRRVHFGASVRLSSYRILGHCTGLAH